MAPKRILPCALAAALATAFAAHAQTPFYVGAAIGSSKASSDLVRDRESNIAPGTPSTLATSSDLKDTVGKIWLGWQALPWLAVEAGYADHGS